ncbi:MAG: NAD(+) synthase [Candidatus Shapirobacteria bacterium]|nr:NAD(+) synthase [Candidatus Shapirobacteria bacterium]
MKKIRVAVVQMEVIPGRPDKNVKKIIEKIREAKKNKNNIVIFPEMAAGGYLIGDEWENESLIRNLMEINEKIREESEGIMVIWGNVWADFEKVGEDGRVRKYNAALIAQNKRWLDNGVFKGHTFKTLLPKYREFDDERYFYSMMKLANERKVNVEELLKPFEVKIGDEKIKIGLTLCEDMWWENYSVNPTETLVKNGAELIINISASPWTWRKNNKRHEVVKKILLKNLVDFIYCNNVGIQNNGKNIFLFDGSSTIYNSGGNLMVTAKPYNEEILEIDLFDEKSVFEEENSEEKDTRELYNGLIYGLKKFFEQTGIKKAVIGVSGGIDSAVSASLVTTVLGKENVIGINMPSVFNSGLTKKSAEKLCRNLEINYKIIPIQESVDRTINQLESNGFLTNEMVRENIQARDRGSRILAGVAACIGGVIINNSNKTEMALGYTTLYGDMNGAICPLGDLYKWEVYEVARYINKINQRELIPKEIFGVVPSAELSDKQDVTKGKGDPILYPYHDKLVRAFVEFRKDPKEILEWYDNNVIEKEMKLEEGLIRKYFKNRNEFRKDLEEKWRIYKLSYFKRIQAPPIIAVSRRAFGYDLRESQNGVFLIDSQL